MNPTLRFEGGKNIAIKVPAKQWHETVEFYRDVLNLPVATESAKTVSFAFGPNVLHIDLCQQLSQAEIWLELVSNEIRDAKDHFDAAGVARCDEIEILPEGFNGFWVSSPSSIIHLVAGED